MKEKLYICSVCGHKFSYTDQLISYIYCDRCGSKINVDYWYTEYNNTNNFDIDDNDDDDDDDVTDYHNRKI